MNSVTSAVSTVLLVMWSCVRRKRASATSRSPRQLTLLKIWLGPGERLLELSLGSRGLILSLQSSQPRPITCTLLITHPPMMSSSLSMGPWFWEVVCTELEVQSSSIGVVLVVPAPCDSWARRQSWLTTIPRLFPPISTNAIGKRLVRFKLTLGCISKNLDTRG